MMISSEQLIEHLKAILQFETDIKNEYDELMDKLHNAIVLEKIKYIRDWEIKHIQLAEELVNTAKKAL